MPIMTGVVELWMVAAVATNGSAAALSCMCEAVAPVCSQWRRFRIKCLR